MAKDFFGMLPILTFSSLWCQNLKALMCNLITIKIKKNVLFYKAFFFPFQAIKSSKTRQLVDFKYFGKNSLLDSARKTLDHRLHRQNEVLLFCAEASLQNLNSLNIFNRILSNTIINKNRHKSLITQRFAVGSYIISCIYRYKDKNPERGNFRGR